MIPELGHFSLILAFCVTLVLAVLPLAGAARGNANWMAVAAPAAWAQFLFVATAYAVLSHAFISHDFSLVYVASNSNRELPLVYRISGVWGAHEGSLMLWVFILSVWTVAVASFNRSLSLEMRARVLGTMGVISLGFLAFALFTSNPFVRQFPYPPDGAD
ncbi:MAG: heme lyase CcmF/NrfE family subunit, partial [Gammaproteobacteria bacterium]